VSKRRLQSSITGNYSTHWAQTCNNEEVLNASFNADDVRSVPLLLLFAEDHESCCRVEYLV